MTVESPWLTVPEAAKYARCGRNRIYNACRTGELKANQEKGTRSGTWRIHRDSIDAWLHGTSTVAPLRSRRRSA